MKKYRFPLTKVLRVRRIEEDQAAARLAAARAAAGAAAAREADSRQALAARCAQGGLQPVVQFLAWTETVMLAGEALSAAKAERAQAEEDVETARVDWSSAATRVSALEHLDERRRDDWTTERRRDEASVADDIVTTRRERP